MQIRECQAIPVKWLISNCVRGGIKIEGEVFLQSLLANARVVCDVKLKFNAGSQSKWLLRCLVPGLPCGILGSHERSLRRSLNSSLWVKQSSLHSMHPCANRCISRRVSHN